MKLFDFITDYDFKDIDIQSFRAFDEWKQAGRFGFIELPEDSELHSRVIEVAKSLQGKTLFVAGIGGSSLGLRAILSSLDFDKTKVIVLDSPDRNIIKRAVSGYSSENSVICVITKSGGTAETLSIFMELRNHLGKETQVVAITDPVSGELRKLAKSNNWITLPVPSNVGGRFSVLSPVGLFPAAFAGIDTTELLLGAKLIADDFLQNKNKSLAGRMTAAFLSKFFTNPIHVFMPYSDLLYDTALWFSQLWAESLGKAKDLTGKTVNIGQTPLACRGPADQHSLVQLFMEGPLDKTVSFITENPEYDSTVKPGEFRTVPTMAYLEGRNPDELRYAEAEATATALSERGMPISKIVLPEISAFYLGQLFMSLEIATALAGLSLGVNPLNQPGVERGKIITYKAMGRVGY